MSSTTPTFSVCIANYNGEAMLHDCIQSILNQSGDHTTEIIVHDDASTDASLRVLAQFEQVIVIESAENVGFCVANNRMAERARGDYVLLLNNDAALLPDALSALRETIGSTAVTGIATLPQCDWVTGKLVDRGCLLDLFYNPIPNMDSSRADVAMVIGACLLMRREDWVILGGFPVWFESIAEDLYLCCLARLRGWPIRVAARSGYRHRQGASFSGERESPQSPTSTFRRRRLSERNKTYSMIICTPTVLIWPLLLLHLLLLLAEGFLLACLRAKPRIFSEIYWGALYSCIGNVSRLRGLRKRVQQSRTTTAREYFRPFRVFPFKLRLLFARGLPRIR